jgi:hypothetical protein
LDATTQFIINLPVGPAASALELLVPLHDLAQGLPPLRRETSRLRNLSHLSYFDADPASRLSHFVRSSACRIVELPCPHYLAPTFRTIVPPSARLHHRSTSRLA